MTPMQCELPGGMWHGARLERGATLAPLTGALEQRLFEELTHRRPWPDVVSAALAIGFQRVAGEVASVRVIDALAVADRKYLMLLLTRSLLGDAFWASVSCAACQGWFDLEIQRSALPVKVAAPGFPFVELELAGHRLKVRVPTGEDQRWLASAELDSEWHLVQGLVARCIVSVNGEPHAPTDAPRAELLAALDRETLERIESALDDLAPDVGTVVTTTCPECNSRQIVDVDPFAVAQWNERDLYREVHAMAVAYHWTETDILALPRARRRLYLNLIEEAHELHH